MIFTRRPFHRTISQLAAFLPARSNARGRSSLDLSTISKRENLSVSRTKTSVDTQRLLRKPGVETAQATFSRRRLEQMPTFRRRLKLQNYRQYQSNAWWYCSSASRPWRPLASISGWDALSGWLQNAGDLRTAGPQATDMERNGRITRHTPIGWWS